MAVWADPPPIAVRRKKRAGPRQSGGLEEVLELVVLQEVEGVRVRILRVPRSPPVGPWGGCTVSHHALGIAPDRWEWSCRWVSKAHKPRHR